MRLYIWSDHHYFHKNIIKYQDRPFEYSYRGMIDNAKLMYFNHKSIVKKDDVVVFLGDVALIKEYLKPYIFEMFKQLPGYKFLVRGNHDTRSTGFYQSLGFLDAYDYLTINQYFLCHYPIDPGTPKIFKDAFLESKCSTVIHGHVHNREVQEDGIKRINVCVDYKDNNYKPLEFTDKCLLNYFKRLVKKY